MKNKIVKSSNRTEYLLNGECHREDGPAIECADGTKEWYIHGKCNYDGVPAISKQTF